MESKTIFLKVIKILGRLLFLVLAGFWAMMAVCLLIASFVEIELLGAIAAIASAFLASLCWATFKDI